MKRLAILALFLMLFTPKLFAQSNEEEQVKDAVNKLFTGMKAGDSTLARSAFAKGSLMQTIVNKDGKTTVRTESVDGFLKFLGTPHKEKYDERIVFTKILIDGPLASVWTDYKFYVDEKFSHCGVNSFQLVKGEKGWQIVYIIDTRRKDGCK
ncbi:nuclear transport factor 2 family protein [Pedobacter punctiformis]|uniref:Nuclear transport factor 2 family protein n=1 Tax=Pedobacter punctiformis TaxID=3004097 RepID=A0ABT4L651_9SPHI|nr:nuclear transport factor 2 family protein [Pedobacter sp. HCMS5-2]MCZ4243399.1 nuclear transport factor 2 family protein [Pedobacter sp. HCMS5-2]